MRTGIADLPLHYGKAPRWLFEKMVKLSRLIIEAAVLEGGPQSFLQRISDPFWFQAFGGVLGFDWHSSGLTTTVCGAMKEGTKDIADDLGLYFCGGKGGTSRKTPSEIERISQKLSLNPAQLIYSSKTAAKVDNACVQDGYNLYHHMFIFTKKGDWSVVQQGMNLTPFPDRLRQPADANLSLRGVKRRRNLMRSIVPSEARDLVRSFTFVEDDTSCQIATRPLDKLGVARNDRRCATTESQVARKQGRGMARRYHWLSLNLKSYVNEPHNAVCCDATKPALNMVAQESDSARTTMIEISRIAPETLLKETKRILKMPIRHPILKLDINPKYFHKILEKTYEQAPHDFEKLISIEGVGPKTIRALALIGELLCGTKPSFRDPARYAFAHGGKDGFPYPVNRETYNQSIAFLESAVKKAKLGNQDKLRILRRLAYM